MTSTTFILLLIGSGVVALAGVIIVAMRRSESEGAATAAEFDRKAMKADRDRRDAKAAATIQSGGGESVATMVAAPAEYKEDDPRQVVSAVEYGVTRRKFFNRALSAVFGLFMLQFTLAGLAFFWPKIKGGFGTPINAGKVIDLKAEVFVAGSIIPKFVPAAQAWIVPFNMEDLEGSSYEAMPFVVAGGEDDGIGIMALWQRCVHLGCRVPSCESSQGFECPCHGSKYNGHGEYSGGPAPRNLDRFGVQVNEAGELIIETGNIVQTPRSKVFTVAYPQGPFCV